MRKWTKEEEIRLKELFEAGVPDVSIAKMLNRTRNSVAVKRVKIGVTDLRKRRIPEESKEKMRQGKRSGELHPNWKGGERLSADGYKEIRIKDHPRARKTGYVYEHLVVAERKIKRPLRPDETVHHINKIRDDNREENLQVLTRSEHSKLHGIDKYRPGAYLKCSQCENTFYRKPSHIKKFNFCSQKCYGEFNLGSGIKRIPDDLILETLKTSKNKKEVAEKLNFSLTTLYTRIRNRRDFFE